MNRHIAIVASCLLHSLSIAPTYAATIGLFEYAFNINGTISNPTVGDTVPASVDLSTFDTVAGLGSIAVSITGTGAHSFLAYFDHEIDEASNTFFNELGEPVNGPSIGQQWEIDEPGFVYGNIYNNFLSGLLDNSVGINSPDDVAVAMGWNFLLTDFETANIILTISETSPTSGFYLQHSDPDSASSIFFSGSLAISGSPTGVPEGGATVALLAIAVGGLLGLRLQNLK